MSNSKSRVTSSFGAGTTAREVVAGHDLSGKTAVITGSSSGIGIETARALAGAGAETVLAVRNLGQGEAIAAAINSDLPIPRVKVELLDLASLEEVRTFARRWGGRPLDILINNAGIMGTPQGYTADGFEQQIGVNHFGHFLLTGLLVPSLLRKTPARVVVLSSSAHLWGDVDLDDLHFRKRGYDKGLAYVQSKTANILFAVALTAHLGARGITANAVMPGMIRTGLNRHTDPAELRATGWTDENGDFIGGRSPEQGAATSVWAAVAPELEGIGGRYLEDCNEAEPWHAGKPMAGVKPYALDPEKAESLWQLSLKATGFPPGFL